jgi:hypothetical protein
MQQMWFAELMGFTENTPNIYRQLSCVDGQLHNQATGRAMRCGQLTMPKLAELRAEARHVSIAE